MCACLQLCETLKRDCPRVHLDAVELDNQGVCIRFAPMETMHGEHKNQSDIGVVVSVSVSIYIFVMKSIFRYTYICGQLLMCTVIGPALGTEESHCLNHLSFIHSFILSNKLSVNGHFINNVHIVS